MSNTVTTTDPLAICEWCVKPTAGVFADCEDPACVAKSIEIEAAWKRKGDR